MVSKGNQNLEIIFRLSGERKTTLKHIKESKTIKKRTAITKQFLIKNAGFKLSFP
ncbi:hypothetical protein GvMRE_I2g606 [endosymbiont GvMRE of Glomus versiforme]|nr:hypothetical protein GvMRE_I2g606 [endosymbiont GvMRE of Glomus versiforme]